MRRYTTAHYEEVADILVKQPIASVGSLRCAVKRIVEDFADLFAADNPRLCSRCWLKEGAGEPCWKTFDKEHEWTKDSFDRAEFLRACGIKGG